MKRILSLLLLLPLAACHKEGDSGGDADKVKFNLLADKKWQVTSLKTRDTSGTAGTDLWAAQPGYVKDDYTVWHATSLAYAVNDNAIFHPGATNPSLDTGSWFLSKGQIQMTSTKLGGTGTTYTIISIATDSLVMEFADTGNTTGIYTLHTIH